MSPKVAAITMAFDEPVFLPIWARHYARQVGADHCYVVDHGSTIEYGLPAGINAMRLPRSAHDDAKRAKFMSEIIAALLLYYDWVIHTDVDEIVIADPNSFPNLPAFCASTQLETVTAIGLDVQQVLSLEQPLDPASPIGLERLSKTRIMPWADNASGEHQRISDARWSALFTGMSMLPRIDGQTFDPYLPPLSVWLEKTTASIELNGDYPHTVDLGLNAPELWSIPQRFRARF